MKRQFQKQLLTTITTLQTVQQNQLLEVVTQLKKIQTFLSHKGPFFLLACPSVQWSVCLVVCLSSSLVVVCLVVYLSSSLPVCLVVCLSVYSGLSDYSGLSVQVVCLSVLRSHERQSYIDWDSEFKQSFLTLSLCLVVCLSISQSVHATYQGMYEAAMKQYITVRSPR